MFTTHFLHRVFTFLSLFLLDRDETLLFPHTTHRAFTSVRYKKCLPSKRLKFWLGDHLVTLDVSRAPAHSL